MVSGKRWVIAAVLAVVTTGCATSVRLDVVRPAEINMAGTRTIAVMDFNYSEGELTPLETFFAGALVEALGGAAEDVTLAGDIRRYATNGLIQELLATKYFTIVSGRDVARAFSGGTGPDAITIGDRLGVDAIIVGDITKMDTSRERYTVREKIYSERLQKKVRTDVPWLRKKVRLSLSYRVVNTVSGAVIGSRRFDRTVTDERRVADEDYITDSEDLYKGMVDEVVAVIARQLAPYRVTEHRYLMGDSTGDPRMKEADRLVKGGFYERALEMYLDVWGETGAAGAGHNGAIMYEALGDLDRALTLMGEVADQSREPTAMSAYDRLLKERENRRLVDQQMGHPQSD